MDRQEAIQTLSKIGKISVSYAEDLYDSFFSKPVVPQCVADWYEEHKEDLERYLYQEVCKSDKNVEEEGLTTFQEWLVFGATEPFKTLVNMHQFGYEVEKEPRYTVRLKGLTSKRNYLNHLVNDYMWCLSDSVNLARARTHHTRKELEEAGFGWVFDCEGVEVKEVE